MTLNELNSEEWEKDESEVQRKAFAPLKPRGSKAKAPTDRVTNVVGVVGKFHSTAPKVNASGPTFKIFQVSNHIPTENVWGYITLSVKK